MIVTAKVLAGARLADRQHRDGRGQQRPERRRTTPRPRRRRSCTRPSPSTRRRRPPSGVRADLLIAAGRLRDADRRRARRRWRTAGPAGSTTVAGAGRDERLRTANDIRILTPFPAATTNTVLQVAGGGKGAYRTLDLSTAAGVTNGVLIEWDYARDLGNGDSATVELCSTAARTSCTVLATYAGPAADTGPSRRLGRRSPGPPLGAFLTATSTLLVRSGPVQRRRRQALRRQHPDHAASATRSPTPSWSPTPATSRCRTSTVTDPNCQPTAPPTGRHQPGQRPARPRRDVGLHLRARHPERPDDEHGDGERRRRRVDGHRHRQRLRARPRPRRSPITKGPAGTSTNPGQIVPSGGTATFVIVVTNTGNTEPDRRHRHRRRHHLRRAPSRSSPRARPFSYSCTKTGVTVAGFNIASVTGTPPGTGPRPSAQSNPAYYAVGTPGLDRRPSRATRRRRACTPARRSPTRSRSPTPARPTRRTSTCRTPCRRACSGPARR